MGISGGDLMRRYGTLRSQTAQLEHRMLPNLRLKKRLRLTPLLTVMSGHICLPLSHSSKARIALRNVIPDRQMLKHDLLSGLGGFSLNKVVERTMRIKNHAYSVTAQQSTYRMREEGSCQAGKDLFQIFISAIAPNSTVKLKIDAHREFGGRRFGVFHHRNQLLQLFVAWWGKVLVRQAKSFRLQHNSQAINFLDILVIQADDKHAAPRNVQDERLLLQLLQRFANWGATYVQLTRKLTLIESLAGLNFSAQNCVRQDFDGAVL